MEIWKSQKQIDNEKDELIKELKKTITELHQALQLQQTGVSKRFYVAEEEPSMKIISRELESKQRAESFIDAMKETHAHYESKMIILNVC